MFSASSNSPCRQHDEQRAIAAALSDADEWIASLDRLIAKKRDIKQAAMQQLLTGKTRLPGFQKKPGYKQTEVGLIPEDWEVATFSLAIPKLILSKMLGTCRSNYGVRQPWLVIAAGLLTRAENMTLKAGDVYPSDLQSNQPNGFDCPLSRRLATIAIGKTARICEDAVSMRICRLSDSAA